MVDAGSLMSASASLIASLAVADQDAAAHRP